MLLLRAYPQTRAMWHRVAHRPADRFTVVCADLRDYGDISKPPGGGDHFGYSKRALAQGQVAVMQELGFETFAVVACWRERADDVSGRALPRGHSIAEEAPDETIDELTRFRG